MKMSEFKSDGSENTGERFTQTSEYDTNNNLIKRIANGSSTSLTYDGDNIATQEQNGYITSYFNYKAGYATLQETARSGVKRSTVTRDVSNKKLSIYHIINSDGSYEATDIYTYDDAKGIITNRTKFLLNGRTKQGTSRMTYDISSKLRIPECFIGNYKARNKPFDGKYGLATNSDRTPSSYACILPTKYYNKYDHWDVGLTDTYKYQADNRGLVIKLETYDYNDELDYTTEYEYESY